MIIVCQFLFYFRIDSSFWHLALDFFSSQTQTNWCATVLGFRCVLGFGRKTYILPDLDNSVLVWDVFQVFGELSHTIHRKNLDKMSKTQNGIPLSQPGHCQVLKMSGFRKIRHSEWLGVGGYNVDFFLLSYLHIDFHNYFSFFVPFLVIPSYLLSFLVISILPGMKTHILRTVRHKFYT